MTFSIVIPFSGEITLLERCVASIPDLSGIEVIVVDNNEVGILPDHFSTRSNVTILYSDNARSAGHARNVGLRQITGKWILFADSDDFFEPGAFDVFDRYKETDADILFFDVTSRFSDTLMPATRNVGFSLLIEHYDQSSICSQNKVRYGWLPPWGKMIRRSLVTDNRIKFEDRVAGNDILFSVQSGFYANKIEIIPFPLYCITDRAGSLTTIRTAKYLTSRFCAVVNSNRFLESKNAAFRLNTFTWLYIAYTYGFKYTFVILWLVFKYRVNIFVGWKRSWKSLWRKISERFRWTNRLKNKDTLPGIK